MPSLHRPKALSSTTLISYLTFDVARDVFLHFLALTLFIGDVFKSSTYTAFQGVTSTSPSNGLIQRLFQFAGKLRNVNRTF